MANNEDYLDSLLRAASSQDNPDSAINKVREINRREAEEAAMAEAKLAEEALSQAVDMPIAQEEPAIEENTVVEEVSVAEDTPVVEDIPVIEENLVIEETPAIEDTPVLEDIAVDEDIPVIEESLLEELAKEESVVEEPVGDTSMDSTLIDEVLSNDPLLDDDTSVEEASNDIDALLKSDFSGEVDMEDISNLFENAEQFANEEAGLEDTGSDESVTLNEDVTEDIAALGEASEEDPLAMSVEDIDSILSDISNNESADGDVAIELESLEKLESELDISEKSADNAEEDTFESSDIGFGEEIVEEPVDELSENAGDFSDLGDMNAGGDIGDLGDLGDISDLLNSLDSNEIDESAGEVDMLDLLNEAVEKQEKIEEHEANEKAKRAEEKALEEAQTEVEKKVPFFKRLFKKKGKTEDEPIVLDENKSLFRKIIDFITAEEEPEEADLLIPQDIAPADGGSEGVEAASGENKEILDEIDGEEEGKGKKKKGKKDKKGKKGKKGSKGGESDGDEDSEEEGSGESKKPKKEKKERKPLALDIDTGKPLAKKNVIAIFILAITILICILISVKIFPGLISNAQARRAYYAGDYETVYESFFGKKLSDSDQILFNKSSVVLKLQRKYDSFSAYMNMDMRTEALDQLLQAVSNYEEWLYNAEAVGATEPFNAQYDVIKNALSVTFGLSEAKAKEIISLPTDLEYSLMCESIAEGLEYINPNEDMPGTFVPKEVEEADSEPVFEDLLLEEGN